MIGVREQWEAKGGRLCLSGTACAYDIALIPTAVRDSEVGTFVHLSGTASLDGLVCTNMVSEKPYSSNFFVLLEGQSTLRNALIADCRIGAVGKSAWTSFLRLAGASPTLADSTLVNNRIAAKDGALSIGAGAATVTNCILWGNVSTGAPAHSSLSGGNYANRVFSSCCAELAAGENGNITINPQFADEAAGDYRLRGLSPAREMGVTSLRPQGLEAFECAADADAYESAPGQPLTVTFSGYTGGTQDVVAATWDFGDGTFSTDWPTATHAYDVPGLYSVTLTVRGDGETATYRLPTAIMIVPKTCYVREGAEGKFPFDTWEKATGDLMEAVAVGSSAVVVTNGTYRVPAPALTISRPLSLTSVEGPTTTTLVSDGGTSVNHRLLTVSGPDDILVAGFTLRDGYANSYGWTAAVEMSSGVLSNCVVSGTRRITRSAACLFEGSARAVDCTFDGNGLAVFNASSDQVGIRLDGQAVMDRCEIFGYRVDTTMGPLVNTYFGASPVSVRGGATLANSLVRHCTNGTVRAAWHRGVVTLLHRAKVVNCTITDNTTGGCGGGIFATGGSVVNSIVYGNVAQYAGADLHAEPASQDAPPTVRNTCASSFADWQGSVGGGCVTKRPNFAAASAGDYRLTALSAACLDAGDQTAVIGDWDLDRAARTVHGRVDMGCYEFAGSLEVPLDGTIDCDRPYGRVPLTVSLGATVVGDEEGLALTWDFGDGSTAAAGKSVSHTYRAHGAYEVRVMATNAAGEEKTFSLADPVRVIPTTCYVSKTGRDEWPYATWETAARNVDAAVSLDPQNVIVSNGVYAVPENGLVLDSDLRLTSVNGPSVTTLDGENRCRPVWLTREGARCEGFTIARGKGDDQMRSVFARVEAGELSNCILTNGSGLTFRDSAVLVCGTGRMTDCSVNLLGMGGNAETSYYWSTVVSGGGVIDRCVIQGYDDRNKGGWSAQHAAVVVEGTGTFRNSLVRDTIATEPANNDKCYRTAVLVLGSGTVENCTVLSSQGLTDGAGLVIASTEKDTPTVRNNIVCGSVRADGSPAADVRDVAFPSAPRITYSCAPCLRTGEGNRSDTNGLFTARRGRPSHLLGLHSPARDAAQTLDWMSDATDLLGNPRIYGGKPDMGCSESRSGGLLLLVR